MKTASCFFAKFSMFFRGIAPIFFFGVILLDAKEILSQQNTIPTQSYYVGAAILSRGEVLDAKKHYEYELAHATRVGGVQWIDAICYHAMLGETEWLLGNIDAALAAHEAAIDLAIENRQWIGRVSFATEPVPGARPSVPWGGGTRQTPVGSFPKEAMIMTGDILTKERVDRGGVLDEAKLRRIDPIEIFRCIATSVRRRNEILGPLGWTDPKSARMVEAFSARATAVNHWSVTWLDLLFGMSQRSCGKFADAEAILGRTLLMAGQFDHPLTACTLLELGGMALERGEPAEAATCFFEASLSAYPYQSWREVAEALEKFATARRAAAPTENLSALKVAFDSISQQRNLGLVTVILSLDLAENELVGGSLRPAVERLRQAQSMLSRYGLARSRYADKANWLESQLEYTAGNFTAGDAAMARMFDGAAGRSLRLWRLRKLTEGLRSGAAPNLSPRSISDLYDALLYEPGPLDWGAFPIESLAFQTLASVESYEDRFMVLFDRDLKDKAFEAAEVVRRRRFLRTQELGGRVLGFRTLLETPEAALPEECRTLRTAILHDWPEYAALSKQAAEIKSRLAAIPVVPASDTESGATKKLYAELTEVTRRQEEFLKRMATSRAAVPILFPPLISAEFAQSLLPEEGSLLTFIVVHGHVYGFLMTRSILDSWTVGSLAGMTNRVAELLKAFGLGDARRLKQLRDVTGDTVEKWRPISQQMLIDLFGDPKFGGGRFSVETKRLAIVPDGPLWYIPFEMLCQPQNGALVPMVGLEEVTVFVSPTAPCAFAPPLRRDARPFDDTVIIPESAAKKGESVSHEMVEKLQRSVLRPVILSSGPVVESPPSVTAFRLGRLVVLPEILGGEPNWSCWRFGRGAGESATNLVFLPRGAPSPIVLAGYHSAAETLFATGASGDEFFLPLMAIFSRGGQTVLMSRWSPGGRTVANLVEQFLSAPVGTEPVEAWKNGLRQVMAEPLDLAAEPRFKGTPPKEPLLADQPFFLGGFLLIDRGFGELPVEPDTPLAKPAEAPEAPGDALPTPISDDEADAFSESEPESDVESETEGETHPSGDGSILTPPKSASPSQPVSVERSTRKR